jgi:hypothetical protein
MQQQSRIGLCTLWLVAVFGLAAASLVEAQIVRSSESSAETTHLPNALPPVAQPFFANVGRFDASLFEQSGSAPQTATAGRQSTSRDAVWDGLLIGAGVGAALGLIPDHYDDCSECHDSLYASVAVGAGVGLLVDLLRSGGRTSSTTSNDDVRLHVIVGPTNVRVGGSMRWR